MEEKKMKNTARLQKVLAMPLVFLFVAMLLVCAFGSANNTYAADDGTRPLYINSADPAAEYTVSWAGYSAPYTPGMSVPMLLPVTITCTNRDVSGWNLVGGIGGSDTLIVPLGNSVTISGLPHDTGAITLNAATGGSTGDW